MAFQPARGIAVRPELGGAMNLGVVLGKLKRKGL